MFIRFVIFIWLSRRDNDGAHCLVSILDVDFPLSAASKTMTDDTVLGGDEEKTSLLVTRHFEVVQSEEEEEEDQQISLSPAPSPIDEPPLTTRTPIDSFDDQALNQLYDDWLALDGELRVFEPKHKEYVTKLDEVESLKAKYRLEFDKYQKKVSQLQKDIRDLRKTYGDTGKQCFVPLRETMIIDLRVPLQTSIESIASEFNVDSV